MNYLEENYKEDVKDAIFHIFNCYVDTEYFGYTYEEGKAEFHKDLSIWDDEDTDHMFRQLLRHIKDQYHTKYHNYDFLSILGWDLTKSEDFDKFVQDEEVVDTLVCAIVDIVHYDLYPEYECTDRGDLICYNLLLELIEERAK